jgi:nucleotide-binding universal stress UspA family protein
MTYRKVLVANDRSPGAFKALAASFSFARRHNAELHMIIVEELPRFPGSIDEVEGEIEAADQRFAPVSAKSKAEAAEGLGLHCHVPPGHAAPTSAEFCRERAFDLLIVEFMGHSALCNRVIGKHHGSSCRPRPVQRAGRQLPRVLLT